LAAIESLLKKHRAHIQLAGSLAPAALLLGWIFLTLVTVDIPHVAAQTGAQTQTQAPAADPPLPDGPGKEIVLRTCVKCHALKIVTNKHATEDEWAASVNNMVNRGAQLSDDEVDTVIDYLSKNFKPLTSDQKPPPDSAPGK
jgi:cytochrome c5